MHIKSHVTNIAARAFAESPKLNLVVFEGYRSPRIAVDAFDGCAPALYGGTVGVPVKISWGVTKVSWGPATSETNTTVYGTRKISLEAHALPPRRALRLFLPARFRWPCRRRRSGARARARCRRRWGAT